MFKHDRNIVIFHALNSSVFEVKASAPDPTAAANLANQRTRELEQAVRSRSKADFSIIQEAVPNQRPTRPVSPKNLTISGVATLNVGVVGVICLIVGLLKGRSKLVAHESSSRTAA